VIGELGRHGAERILVRVRRAVAVSVVLAALLLPACGGTTADEPLDHDTDAPLRVERGMRSEQDGVVVQEVTYASGDDRVEGFLVVPARTVTPLPGVVFLHGAGGDRSEQLDTAVKLARRGAAALTITVPSRGKGAPEGSPAEDLVRWQGGIVAADVVAARRALDLLADDERIDADRLGLVGWSMGGRLAALVAGVDDRVRATVLMSVGAAPVSEYVDAAPAELADVIREVLEPIDPLTRLPDADGAVLVQAGRRDSVVPGDALEAVIAAAPAGTRVEWYPTDHALNADAEADRFDWLAGELEVGSS
jgi:dienelactone hydrolase